MKTDVGALPDFCFVFIPDRPAGQRIGLIMRGALGYYRTDMDSEGIGDSLARCLVDAANAGLCITDHQLECMQVGAMFGWDVRGSDPRASSRATGSPTDEPGREQE